MCRARVDTEKTPRRIREFLKRIPGSLGKRKPHRQVALKSLSEGGSVLSDESVLFVFGKALL